MEKNEQKIESSNPTTKSDNDIKSKEKENQTEMGYSSVLGEYKSESGKNENKEKSTINQPTENKVDEPLTSYNSGTSAYSSSSNIENKESKIDGLKSNVNQPDENKPNITTSIGYNSMEGEYTSTKIENKESKEGTSFSANSQTSYVGLKPTIAQPIETKANVTTTTYNSATGGYSSSSSCNSQLKNSNEAQNQPVVTPLIIQVPSNAPIINKNVIPIGNLQGSITITSTTTTTTTKNSIGTTQMQPPNIIQQMPFGQPQPLEGSTFAEYPQTVSHGIKSSNNPSVDNQPK